MILESADTAWFYGHAEHDVIMSCENCGRRVESSHASISASDKRLCDRCHKLWVDGFNEGVFKRMSGRIRVKGEKE